MRKLLFFISFFIIVFQLFADGVEFTATAPNEVEVGEQFYLRYTLNKRANPNLPNLTGLKVVGGPSISTSTSTQIYNGQMTHTSTFSYTYVIQAISEGAFTIPPASINLGGENYSSNSLSINVLAAGSKPRQQQPTQQRRQRHHDPFSDPFFNRQPAQPQALSKDDIFIRTELDRTNIYQGERITATVKIFTRIDLLGFEDLNIPGYDGFWAQDVDIPNQIQFQNTTVNGANYRMGVLRKTVLFPQRSGKLTIKGVGADVVVRQRVPG
ncbi:MAG: protein BatD, partial [Bacteroidales bacterium]|nr:protein BatD [Bacteroidales bacterium]